MKLIELQNMMDGDHILYIDSSDNYSLTIVTVKGLDNCEFKEEEIILFYAMSYKRMEVVIKYNYETREGNK